MGIVLTLPVLLIITVFLTFTNNFKPFFIQSRPGRNTKIFSLLKFKTMTDLKNSDGLLLNDEDRLTTVGSLIRSLSLDELPQLFNVLNGDMSLVGPRPLLVEYLPLYNKEQARRHEIRPGITGWAQINGRNAVSWKERFNLDIWYVDNISFRLDMKILWLTLLKVIRREGINASGTATMTPFKGNEN